MIRPIPIGLAVVAALAAGMSVSAQRTVIPPLAPITLSAVDGPRRFASDHSGTFNGRRVDYRATVAETIVELPGRHPAASLFSFSYVARGPGDPATRPVIFLFNGGPGAASAPLHLSSMGPKILKTLGPAAFADPSVGLVDNPSALLDVADLVFIDPADTGFSHSLPGATPAMFHSVDGDSQAIAALIALWLRDHGRMASPKYVFGESYGSMRAVALARDLARLPDRIVLDGILLGGPAVTYGQAGNLPNPGRKANELIMMASVAWHYGKIDNKTQSWEQAVDKARRFARSDYLQALEQGFALDDATRERIVTILPALIGISERYFRDRHTIVVSNFNAELLRDRGLVLDRDTGLETTPAMAKAIPIEDSLAGLDHAMQAYGAGDLKAAGLGQYHTTMPDGGYVLRDWDFTTAGAPALDVTLATAMKEHMGLRLLIAQGGTIRSPRWASPNIR